MSDKHYFFSSGEIALFFSKLADFTRKGKSSHIYVFLRGLGRFSAQKSFNGTKTLHSGTCRTAQDK